MTFIIVRPEAEADLARARDWYGRQRIGLGHEFLLSIDEALGRVSGAPELNPIVHKDLRRALVRRFPYAIYYRIDGNYVVVLGIFHAARASREWETRA